MKQPILLIVSLMLVLAGCLLIPLIIGLPVYTMFYILLSSITDQNYPWMIAWWRPNSWTVGTVLLMTVAIRYGSRKDQDLENP